MNRLLKFFISCYTPLLMQSCIREATCEEAANAYRSDDLNIVIAKTSNDPYQLEFEGINPQTQVTAKFKEYNYTWAQWFIDEISIGDTVVKKKGELKFYIHKKDTVLVFPFECKGKIYE